MYEFSQQLTITLTSTLFRLFWGSIIFLDTHAILTLMGVIHIEGGSEMTLNY